MNFLETLKALPPVRQLMLAGAVVGVALAMTFMVRGAMQPPMALLYAGLEPERAGEIISELDQRNVPYKIEQEAIFVPADQRDNIRFALAQNGLPKQAIQGYELLDDVNGFSVTSEMYNASYWRAKEGELTRTILAIPGIASARVHIGASLKSGFSRVQPNQTASVTLSTTRELTTSQAEAIQYLVALAVSGLSPEDVAVIDPKIGILAGPKSDKTEHPGAIAENQAELLEARILRLLEARLGAGNAEVSVALDVTRQRQRVSQVQFDPASRVIRQRTINDVSETNNAGGGALTVASNLPQQTTTGDASKNSTVKNSTESVSYDINETRTETEMLPGEIRKISIGVLLNERSLGIDLESEEGLAEAAQMVAEFEKIIATGAGLDAARGDEVTVELMPFQVLSEPEMTQAPSLVERLVERHLWSSLQALLLGLVVVVLSFGVIRPVLSGKKNNEASSNNASEPDVTLNSIDYLKDYTRERQDETAALLQEWLNEDRKVAVNE